MAVRKRKSCRITMDGPDVKNLKRSCGHPSPVWRETALVKMLSALLNAVWVDVNEEHEQGGWRDGSHARSRV